MDVPIFPSADLVNQFIQMLQNPYVLVYVGALAIGKAYKEATPMPGKWIPLVLASLGAVTGAIIFSAASVTWQVHFKDAVMGGIIALASTGSHQAVTRLLNKEAPSAPAAPATPEKPSA